MSDRQDVCWFAALARVDVRRTLLSASSDRHELAIFRQIRRQEVVQCLVHQHVDGRLDVRLGLTLDVHETLLALILHG